MRAVLWEGYLHKLKTKDPDSRCLGLTQETSNSSPSHPQPDSLMYEEEEEDVKPEPQMNGNASAKGFTSGSV
ncbi:hypothetical protein KIL84_000577 [Mauremys mutica]|uniref:Uncharacterized protein n=1 Tax=Mauremys mutica TaxID=74926 RepID=A0A9D3WYU2_9SAUR|nr:hypothetical protein KIL84_000577 [Mauremys mutica]